MEVLTLREVNWDIDEEERPPNIGKANEIIREIVPEGGNITVDESLNDRGYSKAWKYIVKVGKSRFFVKLCKDQQEIQDAQKGSELLINALREANWGVHIGKIISEYKVSNESDNSSLYGISYDLMLKGGDPLQNLNDFISQNPNVNIEDIDEKFLKPVLGKTQKHESGVLGCIYGDPTTKYSSEPCKYHDVYPYNQIMPTLSAIQQIRDDNIRDAVLGLENYRAEDPIGRFKDLLSQEKSIHTSLIHGDLNMGNLLEEGYLIDFDHVEKGGHIAFDLAKLETEVKRHFVSVELQNTEDLIKFEELLHLSKIMHVNRKQPFLTCFVSEDIESINDLIGFGEQRLHEDGKRGRKTPISFEVIRKIREYAKEYVSYEEYLYALIFTGLASLKYRQTFRHKSAYILP